MNSLRCVHVLMRGSPAFPIAISALLFSQSALCDEKSTADVAAADKHRLDLTIFQIDVAETDFFTDVILFGYTHAFNSSTRAGLMAGVTNTRQPRDSNAGGVSSQNQTGLSDTVVTFQHDFSEKMTVSPWVPKTLGLGASVIIPTGDADDGLSIDAWLLALNAGWGFELFSDFWLVPGFGYQTTFSEGDFAVPSSLLYASLPIVWVSDSGFWVGYSYTIMREFEEADWLDDHGVTVGKMFRNGFSISLDYGTLERVGSLVVPDDALLVLNFYYQFGR
ncbi:MAG: hypothetical protein QNK43_03985 [Amphritea sp.]|nr:hypothetical protein [Amphritea sp.]